MRRRSARSRRCWSASPSNAGCSATCPSPATASATCTRPTASSTRRSRATARAWRSPRRWPSATRRTSVGSTTCPSATTASATCSSKKGDREAALASFRKGLAIAKALALREPDNAQWQWDLSASHDRIGDVLIAEGKLDEALPSYRRGLADRRGAGQARSRTRRLAARPGRQLPQDRLARGRSDNPGEARELLEKGRAIIARLDRIAAHQAQWRSDLSKFDEVLRTLQ